MPGSRKNKQEPGKLVRTGDLVPDGRLADPRDDRLEHEAVARGVAEIALSAIAPVNIALFGPWGSGKSSVFSMVKAHIETLTRNKTSVVRYDAWKYGGQELKRNFIESVALELDLGNDPNFNHDLHEVSESTDLRLGSWAKRNWPSLLLGIVGAVLISAVCLVGLAAVTSWLRHIEFDRAVVSSLAAAGTVFGLSLVALLVGPKVLEGAVVKVSSAPPTGDDQFSIRFAQLVTKVRKRGAKRLVVFIDELDRCAPEDVVATLVDLKTFLDQPNCVFIVAADREVIERSLRKVPQAKPVRDSEPYYATPGAFLDKIFQHQIALPPLRPRALTRFARALVEDQGGVWAEMREYDPELFETVVFTLVPVHVRSPRRVKVLLNDFATRARIAQARGIPWMERAREIAVLSVLETEFPTVAAEMLRIPRLLKFLRQEEEPGSDEARRLVAQFGINAGAGPDPQNQSEDDQTVEGMETVAGALLTDGQIDREGSGEARKTLKHQLSAYLSKIGAANIPDPKPDLLYLQGAGHDDGLADPHLGDAVDFASDTAPEIVLAAFNGQPSPVIGVAVRLIVAEGEDNFGPGKMLAYESACRLAEGVDLDDLRTIAGEVAPAVLASRGQPGFPLEAVPGAIILAMLTRNDDAVSELVKRANAEEPSDDLVSRIASTLPYATPEQARAVRGLLVAAYPNSSVPLHTALSTLPLGTAMELWGASGESVARVLTDLETPAATSDPATRVRAGTRPAAAPEPAATGNGRATLRELISAVKERTDGDALLSMVFLTLQQTPSSELQEEVQSLADEVLGRLTDERLIERHVLAGISTSTSGEWERWRNYFANPTADEERGEDVRERAATVLVDKVLPQVRQEPDTAVLSLFPGLVVDLANIAGPAHVQQVCDALEYALTELAWELNADDELLGITAELRIQQRTATHEVARALKDYLGPDSVDGLLARDVYSGVETIPLEDPGQSQLLILIESLSPKSSKQLSDLLDGYAQRDGEAISIAHLKVRARLGFDGPPLAASDLADIDAGTISTTVATEWLRLGPPVEDVIAIRSGTPLPAAPLGEYASTLTVEDRTALWISLEAANGSDGLLRAVGRSGVDAPAIEHAQNQFGRASRQLDRDRSVERLLTAVVQAPLGTDAARKATSDFIRTLLGRDIAGDARLAAKLAIWAGGAAYGHQTAIRKLFDDALDQRDDLLGKGTLRDLNRLGLITPKKRGPFAWLLGH